MHASKSSINRETPELVIKSIFKRYDEDESGALDPKEFANALDDLGIIDEYEQAALFALADADNSKTIEYDEFLRLIKGHDFEILLSNREDYLFVIETYKTFQEYDIDGDGEVSWNEFYHYLSGHGYSHEYISQYWHYLDNDQTLTITFDEFWKGFKAQAEALKQQALHQEMTQQLLGASEKSIAIDEYNNYLSPSPASPATMLRRKTSHRSQLLGGRKHQRINSLIGNNSFENRDKNNIFRVMKRHLKKTKQKKRSSGMKLGRVLESDDSDTESESPSSEDEMDEDDEDSDGRNHLGLPLPMSKLRVRKSNSMDDLLVGVGLGSVNDLLTPSDEYQDSIDDEDMDSSELLDETTSSYESGSLDATDSDDSMSLDVMSDEEDDMLLVMTQDIMRLGRDLRGNEYVSKSQDDIEQEDRTVNRHQLKKNTDRDKEMEEIDRNGYKQEDVFEFTSILKSQTVSKKEDKICTKSVVAMDDDTKASESDKSTANHTTTRGSNALDAVIDDVLSPSSIRQSKDSVPSDKTKSEIAKSSTKEQRGETVSKKEPEIATKSVVGADDDEKASEVHETDKSIAKPVKDVIKDTTIEKKVDKASGTDTKISAKSSPKSKGSASSNKPSKQVTTQKKESSETIKKKTTKPAMDAKEDPKIEKKTERIDTKRSDTKTRVKSPKLPPKGKSKDTISSDKTPKESTIQSKGKGTKAKKQNIARPKDLKTEEAPSTKSPKTQSTPVKTMDTNKKKRKTQPKTPKIEPQITTKPVDETVSKQTEHKSKDKPTKPVKEKAAKAKTKSPKIATKPKDKDIKKGNKGKKKSIDTQNDMKDASDDDTKQAVKEVKVKTKAIKYKKTPISLSEIRVVEHEVVKDPNRPSTPVKSVYMKRKKRKSAETPLKKIKTKTAKTHSKTPVKTPTKIEPTPLTNVQPKTQTKPGDETDKSIAKPAKDVIKDTKIEKQVNGSSGSSPKNKDSASSHKTPKQIEKTSIEKGEDKPAKDTRSQTPRQRLKSRSKLKLKRAASGDLALLRRLPPKRQQSRRKKRSRRSVKTGTHMKRKEKEQILDKINSNNASGSKENDDASQTTPPPAKSELKLIRSDSKEVKVSEAAAVVVGELGEKSKDNTTDTTNPNTHSKTETEAIGEDKPKTKSTVAKPRDKKRAKGLLKPKKTSNNNKRSSTPNFLHHKTLKNNAQQPAKRTRFRKKKRSKKRLGLNVDVLLPSASPSFRSASSNPNQKTQRLALTPGAPSALMKKKSKHRMAYSSQTPDPDLDSLIDNVLSPASLRKKKNRINKHRMAYSAQPADIDALIDSALSPKDTKPPKRKKKKKCRRRKKKSKVAKYKKRRGSLDLDTEAVAIHKSEKNLFKKKRKKHKKHTNYRVRDKEERRKEMKIIRKQEEEVAMMSRAQTERQPAHPSIKKKKKMKIEIPKDKKSSKKRVTFTNTGNKVSKTLAKLRLKMNELNEKQNKSPKHQLMTPRDIRKKTKKSDYIQRKSVGHGFDLFKNYRMKTKEEKEQTESTQTMRIQTQLRERKKSLVKPPKLDKRGRRLKANKRKKVQIPSPFADKLNETMYDHRPSLRGKINAKGGFPDIEIGPGAMIMIDEDNEKEFSDKKKKKKKKNVDHKANMMTRAQTERKPPKSSKMKTPKSPKTDSKSQKKKIDKKEGKKTKDEKPTRGWQKMASQHDHGKKQKKKKGHKRVRTKHGSWELDKKKLDLGHLGIETKKKNYRVRDKERRRKLSQADEPQSQTEQHVPKKNVSTKQKKGNTNQSATEKKLNKKDEKAMQKKKKSTYEESPPLNKLKHGTRKRSHENQPNRSGNLPSKLKLRRALSSDHKLMAQSLHASAKNTPRKKMRKKPRKLSPLPSPKHSSRYSSNKSQTQTPKQAPRHFRKRPPSPAQSPKQSPRYSRKKSPAQSPKQSPRYSRKKSPGQSPAQSPKQSPRFARKQPKSNLSPDPSPHNSPPLRPKSSKNRKQRPKKGTLDVQIQNKRSQSTMGMHGARQNNVKRGRSDVEVRPKSRKKKNKAKQSEDRADSDCDVSQRGDYTIKVKLVLNGDIRRWRYHNQCNLSALKSFATMSFDLFTFRLQYEDDEGDILTLVSENDLYDAFECAEEEDRKSLKIYVVPSSSSPPIRKAKTQRSRQTPAKSKTVKGHKKKSMEVKVNSSPKKGRKRANSLEDQESRNDNTETQPRRKGKKGKTTGNASVNTNTQARNGTKRKHKSPDDQRSLTDKKKDKNKKGSGGDDESSISKFARSLKKRLSSTNANKSKNGKTKKIVKR